MLYLGSRGRNKDYKKITFLGSYGHLGFPKQRNPDSYTVHEILKKYTTCSKYMCWLSSDLRFYLNKLAHD